MTDGGTPTRATHRIRAAARAAFGGRGGTARLGLVLAAAAVLGGMTLGSGVASKAVRSGYDMAWLPDSTRGQLVQIDPVVGRANVRLQVADPGSTLSIQQGDGQLVVVDRKTGKVTSIDLGTLLVGGTRTERPGDGVKVMLAGSRLFVADLPRGTVRAVDPATQADVGRPWSAGGSLVDVGVDGNHDVWALDSGQHLVRLHWTGATLAPISTRTVQGAGPGSVIVGHDRGVTLIGSRGAIVRVGTGRDTRLDAPRVSGPLRGPQRSPDGLVPVSAPGTSSVVIVGPTDAVVDDVSGYGCERPGAPTAFDGKVYVPCSGAHKVLVLDASGGQVGSAIPTPGDGDPQLTVSGGRLVIDVPGSGRATVVDAAGRTRDFPTVAPGVGVQNPNAPPPTPPQPPKIEPTKPRGDHGRGDSPRRGNGTRGDGGDRPGQGGQGGPGRGEPSNGPSDGASGSPVAPAGATAQARSDGSVLVSWGAVSGAGATVVTATSTGGEVASVPAGATSATVTVLDPGTTTSFHVRNAKVDATTNSVTTATTPGAVSGVSVTTQQVEGGRATLAVTWQAAAANGARVSYAVSAGGTATKTTGNLNATISVPCSNGCSGTVTVTARNSAGASAAGSGRYEVSPPTNPGTPTQPANPQPPTTQAPAPEPTTQAPPPQVAMPSAGAALITTGATAGSDNTGNPATATVTITSPSDWAAFPGTCDLYVDGSRSETVPCNASGWSRSFEYYETGSHEFYVVASDSGRTVESAHMTQRVVYRQVCLNSASQRQLAGAGAAPQQRPICDGQPTCPNCQIPFLSPRVDLDGDRPAARPVVIGVGRWLR